MRAPRDLGRARDEIAIEIGGVDARAPVPARTTGRALLMSALGARRRVAIGPADAGKILEEIIDGRGARLDGRRGRLGGRRMRTPRAAEVVELDGDLVERVRGKRPDELYLVLDGGVDADVIAGLGARLLMDGVAVHMVLATNGAPPVRARVGRVGRHAAVSLHAVDERPLGEVVRRLVDVVGAASLLVLLTPVLALVAALVWWRMGWPVVYSQQRVGRGGRRFPVYKFRSMVANADQVLRASPALYRRYVAFNHKLPEEEDPRITPLGRLLRRTSLDELPQLWNVIRGDMSLVGPRPVVPDEVAEYGDWAGLLLRAKPGVTGAWQVGGRSAIGYPERARIDLHYVAGRSLSEDVRILLRTLPAVLRRRGAM